MFSRYFQSELTYLRELGREFAARHPAFAGLFAERGGDPDVERLLEGFAFLTARIRERIDDAVPEVIEAVAEMVVPQAVRTLPACSVVEFVPKPAARKNVHLLPEGTEVGARAVDGSSPLFRTTAPTVLLPLELGDCRLDAGRARTPTIDIPISRFSTSRPDTDRVRIFVHAPAAQASTLSLWLARHLAEVTLRFGNVGEESVVRVAPRMRHVGVDGSMDMLPWPELAPDGLRLLQELFTLPSKLAFFELDGLFAAWSDDAPNDAVLRLAFDGPPDLPERLEPETFRLHCVPVINLFRVAADPITLDLRSHEHLVRAAGFSPHHAEVYSVDQVTSIRRRDQRRRIYTPFYAFRHLEAARAEQAFYTLRRVRSPLDDAIDTYVSVMTPRDVEPALDEEVLSLDLTCTSRRLTEDLRVGDISVPTPRSPTVATFTNLTRVSKPVRPSPGAERHWRTVAHLALNLGTITRAEPLRALLSLYNLHEEADHQLGRTNARRVDAVREVTTRSSRRVVEGIPLPGFATRIVLEDAGFASFGDAFLFGCAIDSLFASEAPLNLFSELRIELHPSTREISWTPRTGTQPLL